MGLDMYLYANHYVSRIDWEKSGPGQQIQREEFTALVNTLDCREAIDNDDVMGFKVSIPIGYWRKANAIHNWFVKEMADGRDECQDIYCAKENLKELLNTCKNVLKERNEDGERDMIFARENLPTQGGFFFGSTDYDEYYYEDLNKTIEILDRALASKYDTFIYRASW
jgi:hypothetical protein